MWGGVKNVWAITDKLFVIGDEWPILKHASETVCIELYLKHWNKPLKLSKASIRDNNIFPLYKTNVKTE